MAYGLSGIGSRLILGITATRNRLSKRQWEAMAAIISGGEVAELHHGDCVGGDEKAHDLAVHFGIPIFIHPPVSHALRAFSNTDPPNVTVLEPKLYMERNHDIVDACDFLLALPGTKDEVLRSGTWATIRYARKIGKPHEIVTP